MRKWQQTPAVVPTVSNKFLSLSEVEAITKNNNTDLTKTVFSILAQM